MQVTKVCHGAHPGLDRSRTGQEAPVCSSSATYGTTCKQIAHVPKGPTYLNTGSSGFLYSDLQRWCWVDIDTDTQYLSAWTLRGCGSPFSVSRRPMYAATELSSWNFQISVDSSIWLLLAVVPRLVQADSRQGRCSTWSFQVCRTRCASFCVSARTMEHDMSVVVMLL